jgi:hypothetical protein
MLEIWSRNRNCNLSKVGTGTVKKYLRFRATLGDRHPFKGVLLVVLTSKGCEGAGFLASKSNCAPGVMEKITEPADAACGQVLMYDWSEGGDTEVVVEDIERLNMDYWDKYDKQQKDWRMHTEVPYNVHTAILSF